MKAKFSRIPTRTVVITHGDESVELTLTPTPFGYGELVERQIPIPMRYVNGKPAVDPADENETRVLRMYVLIAKSLGEQLESVPPDAKAGSDAWRGYARAVKAEFLAANFLEGDFVRLVEEVNAVNSGSTAGNA